MGLEVRNLRLPRLRGDGPPIPDVQVSCGGAAPPTRGWTLEKKGWKWTTCGCPAYAGMDPPAAFCRRNLLRLPRLRGDGPFRISSEHSSEQAAPPTRGWTQIFGRGPQNLGGCPAYAGMDPLTPSRYRRAWWLPRLRGDGPG